MFWLGSDTPSLSLSLYLSACSFIFCCLSCSFMKASYCSDLALAILFLNSSNHFLCLFRIGFFSTIRPFGTLANFYFVVFLGGYQSQLVCRHHSRTEYATSWKVVLLLNGPWIFVWPAAQHDSLEVIDAVCIKLCVLASISHVVQLTIAIILRSDRPKAVWCSD